MGDFVMPSLGADMESGTVSQWLIKPGDEVHRGDVVATVETEKSTIEVEIFESGVVDELLVDEGDTVPVGTVIAHITDGTPETTAIARGRGAEPAAAQTSPAETHPAPVHSPVVRQLAAQLGVDLLTLSGTGIGGTVTRADVERAAHRASEQVPSEEAPDRSGGAGPSRLSPVARPQVADRVRSSPFARQRAAELGIDLSTVAGSGPGGSVTEHDVRRVTPAPSAETSGATLDVEGRQAAMRRAIGELMARSKREIPHYYLSTTIDLTPALSWLERENLERPVTSRLVPAVMLLKATARAVARVPEVNGFMIGGSFVPSEAVHVGVAVSLRTGGVVAPAIHDADRLSLDEFMAKLKDLVGRARSGVLRSSEVSDPTITVTNLGDLGVEAVFGVIYPPQVALVGFGRVIEQPWARDGMLGVRRCVTATLSADHRVSDGHRGGRFLTEIDRLVQEPEKL